MVFPKFCRETKVTEKLRETVLEQVYYNVFEPCRQQKRLQSRDFGDIIDSKGIETKGTTYVREDKKPLAIAVIAAVVVVIAVVVFGFGRDHSIVGAWELVDLVDEDRYIEMHFFYDGTGKSFSSISFDNPFTWSVDGNRLTMHYEELRMGGVITQHFRISGSRLTLIDTEWPEEWIFRRIN